MSPFIVAEIGAAHNGSLDRAVKLVDAAHAAGADAVKFQCWATMALPGHIIADGPWKGRDLADLYAEAKTPWAWFPELFSHAKRLGIEAFATPFDRDSVDFLASLDCPRYKIASCEITDLPLILYVGMQGKPMIVSTGMATLEEIDAAARATGRDVTMLKCVSAYPARAEDMNLRTLVDMDGWWDVGLSDHTQGSAVACAAVALGATVIEKHIGLDRTGLDGGFCTLPDDFARYVADVRAAAASLGVVRYGPTEAEASTLALRRSLWVVADVRAGDAVSSANVRSLRPAGGLSPGQIYDVLGRTFLRDVAAGSALVEGMV